MQSLLPSLAPYLFGLFTGASSAAFLALVVHRRRCAVKGYRLHQPPDFPSPSSLPVSPSVHRQRTAAIYNGYTSGHCAVRPDRHLTITLDARTSSLNTLPTR